MLEKTASAALLPFWPEVYKKLGPPSSGNKQSKKRVKCPSFWPFLISAFGLPQFTCLALLNSRKDTIFQVLERTVVWGRGWQETTSYSLLGSSAHHKEDIQKMAHSAEELFSLHFSSLLKTSVRLSFPIM